jgi:hypothetical protein
MQETPIFLGQRRFDPDTDRRSDNRMAANDYPDFFLIE